MLLLSFTVCGLLMHVCLFISELAWLLADISVSGARWADFTCWMSRIMICNLSCQPCDRPFSLVSKKHSHMFKIGQFHSVVRPQWYMGPLGLRFMALWTLCALTRAQWLQSERKNGFVLWTLSKVPDSPTPRRHGPKCQTPHQERINRKNDTALYNLRHFQIFFRCLLHLKQEP